jgi:CRISPR-associated protein Cas2
MLPRQVGLPRGELPLILLYDIEEDRVRARVADACLDYGLERIQFSAFFGRLTKDKREELTLRLLREIEKRNVRIRIIPFTEECVAAMWEYDWWRRDADEKIVGEGGPASGESVAEAVLPSIRFIRVVREE